MTGFEPATPTSRT